MILHGNALEVLQTIEPESVHTCVTSPPYFGLRDYGLPETIWNEVDYLPLPGMGAIHIIEWKGCLGLEPTIEMFVGHIILIFREVHKILRKDGTVWVNFGDSYSGSGKGSAADPENAKKYKQGTSKGMLGAVKTLRKIETSCKPKDMMGIPWRVAFALQADGWYLRQDIIWNKPNPMPESVTDRCAKSHEYIFLMSKSRTYYFDSEAIKEPISTATAQRIGQDIENQKGSDRVPGKTNGNMKAVIAKGNRKSFRGGGSYTGATASIIVF
jgi:DNA modification methylase